MDGTLNQSNNLKTIITETKTMKARYGMCFFINAICYIFAIYLLIKHNICYWQFYIFILIAFVASTSLTYHFFTFILSIPERTKKNKKNRETKKRNLEARYAYYNKLWNSFFTDIEKKFFIGLVKKRTNFGIMPIMREPFQLEDLHKNKLIIEHYLINDFVIEEFDTLFLKWVKKTQI